MEFSLNCHNYKGWSNEKKIDHIIERSRLRQDFYEILIRFCGVCLAMGIRMIFENPWSMQTYLKANFIKAPDIVDMNRMERGDFYMKPTAYWFWNCEPTHGFSRQNDKPKKSIVYAKKASRTGLCSEERSMISPDYARNWICDFVLGKYQPEISGPTLFDMEEYIQ